MPCARDAGAALATWHLGDRIEILYGMHGRIVRRPYELPAVGATVEQSATPRRKACNETQPNNIEALTFHHLLGLVTHFTSHLTLGMTPCMDSWLENGCE